MIKRYVQLAVAAAFVAASTASNVAFAVYEAEPNDSMSSAQEIIIGSGGGVAQVTGTISSGNDVDYFYFEGQKGDVVTIDIDGAAPSFDSLIMLHGPGFPVAQTNDDPEDGVVDSGSESLSDSRLDKKNLPESGRFVVGVSSFPKFFETDGSTTSMTGFSSGSYTLFITVERPAPVPTVQRINIDVRPGRDVARIHPKFKGNIPVALLSSDKFDPLKADRKSLTFGARGDENSLRWCEKRDRDFNGDGRPDLLCHFDNGETGFEEGDLQGKVMGQTTEGQQFEGSGELKVERGGKRHRHHRRGHDRHDHDRHGHNRHR